MAELLYLMGILKGYQLKMSLINEKQLHAGSTVHVSGSMLFHGEKDDFLTNAVNKQKFIHLLADHLSRSGCYVEHAKADADLLIVQNAIAAANKNPNKPSILVADDTDILILLC
jgi:hypothetical protein